MPIDRPTSPRKPHHLERLLEVSRTLSSIHDLPQLLQTVVDSAAELTLSEAASILLYDPTAGELRFEAASGAPQGTLSTLSVPLDSSIAGWVFTHTRPMVVQDAAADPRVYRRVDSALQFKTRSILGVPLLVKREAIGVIEAVNKHPTRNYTEDDLAILETLAAQAAIAIENARLLIKLQDANAELTRLDRMKSDFIAIASHELRTPLGLILGHATFLKEIIPADYQEQMEVIIRSAMRLKSIIEDLSTISHKEEGQSRVRRAPFSLSKLAQDMVLRFGESAAEKQIEIGCDVPSQDPVIVSGDRDKIEVALSNLIRNALAFTDKGGQIGVKVEGEGGYARVFVVDTGIGIPAADIDRVFERFYQVESHLTRTHGGMGLGLSISKAMVEMHGGQIWCESKEGMGSLFCFMVPIDEQQAAAAAKVFRTA
jgi:signal transduction histidine kinase